MNFMRKKKAVPLYAFLVGLLLFGGSAGAAYAASSDTVTWRNDGKHCFTHTAHSSNTSVPTKGSGVLTVRNAYLAGCSGSASASIGNSAFLKKGSGAACASASPTYVTAASKTRDAYYSSSACGVNVSLQGTTTSYAYNGTGYSSASIAAPYANFSF